MGITFGRLVEELDEIPTQTFDGSTIKDDTEYWHTVNPNTGFRYDIPLLLKSDIEYVSKYISFMKLKETDPAAFGRILQWA